MPPTLWADRDFVRFWIGQTASQLGAQASQVTLPLIAVTTLGASAAQLGLLRAVQQAPILLFSLYFGALADRSRARRLMVLSDLGRALVLGLIPIAFLLDVFGLPWLYAVAFVTGILMVSFDVAYQASLPRLIGREQLPQGNSLLEGSRSASWICGPALGGGMMSLLTAPIAALGTAAFFVVSFLSLQRIRRSDAPPPAERVGGMLRQIRAGVTLVFGNVTLRTIAIASCVYQFSYAALITAYLLFLSRTLHLSGAELGLVLAASGPGALLGSYFSASLPRRFGYGRVLIVAALISDVAMLCVPALDGSVVLLMVLNFLYGTFSQTVDIATMAIRQTVTPLELQGRVVATLNFLGLGLMPIGSLVGGVLAAHLGNRSALLLAALGLCLSPLTFLLSPLRKLR
ncbi:MFS transporter [Kribbella sp. NBC_00382]|uniref:MFS transporter n=1 Tax=Kribbella sp. NBC_00382 TaxID=2975967 RepID=UPI002E201F0C